MNLKSKSDLKDIYSYVANEANLSSDFVEKVYKSYWRAIREHIVSLPLKSDLTDEEFLKTKHNVNIPSIGKLYISLDRYRKIKEVYKNFIEKKNAAHKED